MKEMHAMPSPATTDISSCLPHIFEQQSYFTIIPYPESTLPTVHIIPFDIHFNSIDHVLQHRKPMHFMKQFEVPQTHVGYTTSHEHQVLGLITVACRMQCIEENYEQRPRGSVGL